MVMGQLIFSSTLDYLNVENFNRFLIIGSFLLLTFITFAVIQFVPGGPIEQITSQLNDLNVSGEASSGSSNIYRGSSGLDEDHIEQLREYYGFDKPFLERFGVMMTNYLTFDLGDSYFHHQSVTELIIDKLPVSISLGLWSFVIIYSICIPLGIKKAVRHGTNFDLISSTVILIGYSIPGFVLGIGLRGCHKPPHRIRKFIEYVSEF